MVRKLFGRVLAIAALLLTPSLAGVAHAEWHEAGSKHFVVYSNDDPAKIQKFATDLEKFDKAMRVLRNLPDPEIGKANRLSVYVVGSAAEVAKLIGDKWVAGFYSGRATGSVAFVPRKSDASSLDPMQVLLHEYGHHLMFSMSANAAYPLWFSEGWAEFHATAQFRKDGGVNFGAPLQSRAYSLLDGNWLKADKLMIADSLKLTDEQREGLYGRGWLLTHYLTIGGAHKGELTRYITAINDGKTPVEAAGVFGDLAKLDAELEKYKRGRFQMLGLDPAKLPIGEITIRKMTPGEAATMQVRILSKNGVDEKTAPGVYAQAKKACAPFPTDPGAQMVLAEAAFDAKDYPAAIAAADRAMAADPQRNDAYLYKAMGLMEQALAAGDIEKARWIPIRKLIAAANRLDLEDPEPLILYYRSYVEQGETPPEVALDGMYKAFELAPQDPGLRMNVAQIYMHEGDFDTARWMLRPLAFDPHNRGLAEAAAEMIKEVDRRAAAAGGKKGSEEEEKPAG